MYTISMDVYSQFGQWSTSCHPKPASTCEEKPHNSEAFFEDRQGQEKAPLKYMQKGLES